MIDLVTDKMRASEVYESPALPFTQTIEKSEPLNSFQPYMPNHPSYTSLRIAQTAHSTPQKAVAPNKDLVTSDQVRELIESVHASRQVVNQRQTALSLQDSLPRAPPAAATQQPNNDGTLKLVTSAAVPFAYAKKVALRAVHRPTVHVQREPPQQLTTEPSRPPSPPAKHAALLQHEGWVLGDDVGDPAAARDAATRLVQHCGGKR